MLKTSNANEAILVFKSEEPTGVWVGYNNMPHIFKTLS